MVEHAMPDTRANVVADVAEILELDIETAERVVASFEKFVAEPIVEKISAITPADVAGRNPYAYAALGITSIADWTQHAADDIAASSLEGLMGTWLEEVAIIVSGGIKPGAGVDLQVERETADGLVVELYAIQSTTNTKNAGGSRSDEDALNTSAQVLRAGRRYVDLFVGYLYGRKKTTQLRGITRMASGELWDKLSGQTGFRRRLYLATARMSALVSDRVSQDRTELVNAVGEAFGDEVGTIDPTTLPL